MTMLNQVIELFAHFVDYVGIGIIFWGVTVGFVGLISMQRKSKKTDVLQATAALRCKLGTYILLGLEFLIASDIARTVIEPTHEKVVLLGAIVAIRTILSFFLNRELESLATQSSP